MSREEQAQRKDARSLWEEIILRITSVENDVIDILERGALSGVSVGGTDTAPTDDTSTKKLTVQKLAAPPANAAYIAFSNNPGADTFYLILEDA